jgi:PEP-CTERM motif
MNVRTFPILLASFLLGVASLTFTIKSADASPLTIYASFDFDYFARDTPTTSIALNPGAWHVGAPDGALATDAQVHAVLSNLTGMTIGATAQGKPLGGGTTAPFGFFLDMVQLGSVLDAFISCCGAGWTTVDGSAVNWTRSFSPVGGAIYRLVFSSQLMFAGFNADPALFTGNFDAAFGHALSFRFGGYYDVAGPAYYDFHSGQAILTGDAQDVSQVPEPASLSLLATGLAAFAVRRRKSLG